MAAKKSAAKSKQKKKETKKKSVRKASGKKAPEKPAITKPKRDPRAKTLTSSEKVSEKKADGFLDKIRVAHSLLLENKFTEAIEICDEILLQNPDCPEALNIIGLCAFKLGDQGRALTLIEHAHELDPECKDYVDALSYIYTYVGKLADGLYYAKLSEVLFPHPDIPELTPRGLSDYGTVLKEAGNPAHYLTALRAFTVHNYEGAIHSCDKELRLNKDNVDAYQLLGRALFETGRYSRAVSAFHAAIHLQPDNALAQAYLGLALIKLGKVEEGISIQDSALDKSPDNFEVQSCALQGAAFLPDKYQSEYHKRVRKIVRAEGGASTGGATREESYERGRKIRIGYVSDMFHSCEHTLYIEPLLRYHDRNNFDVYCYSTVPAKDLVTARFENYVHSWRGIYDFDDEIRPEVIKRDGIDILVDLCFSSSDQAMDLMSHAPTVSRVSLFGRPEAASLPGITDYISDPLLADADSELALEGQEQHIIENGLYAYDSLPPHATVSAPPFEENGFVTFGGASDLSLLSPEVVAVWANILSHISYARLHLGLTPRRSIEEKQRVLELFAHHGVMDRISLQEVPGNEGRAGDSDDLYMDFFQSVDVFLDTFPVSAAKFIPLSLWLGVPVITMRGVRRPGLLGASLLRSAGKDEWIAENINDYNEIADKLTVDPQRLKNTRDTLQNAVSESALFQPWKNVRMLETIYARILGL